MAGPIGETTSSPRYTLALGGIIRQPSDSLANPYGNDSVEIKGHLKEKAASTPEFGGYGEFNLTFPSGFGVGYRVGVLATPSTDKIMFGQRGDVVIESRDAVVENSCLFSWTPVGSTPGSFFSFRLGAGPTVASILSSTTHFKSDGNTTESSSFQHRVGASTGVDMNIQLLNSVGLMIGGSATFFGSAGTMLGAHAGLSLDL
ncbi:MAG: hypothetical protein ABIH56_02385 [Candidatus Margulisiibacteriota bacterium]